MKKQASLGQFQTGNINITNAAIDAIMNSDTTVTGLLLRHTNGNYGHVSSDLTDHNNKFINERIAITSLYQLSTGAWVYIITKEGHSATTIVTDNEQSEIDKYGEILGSNVWFDHSEEIEPQLKAEIFG